MLSEDELRYGGSGAGGEGRDWNTSVRNGYRRDFELAQPLLCGGSYLILDFVLRNLRKIVDDTDGPNCFSARALKFSDGLGA